MQSCLLSCNPIIKICLISFLNSKCIKRNWKLQNCLFLEYLKSCFQACHLFGSNRLKKMLVKTLYRFGSSYINIFNISNASKSNLDFFFSYDILFMWEEKSKQTCAWKENCNLLFFNKIIKNSFNNLKWCFSGKCEICLLFNGEINWNQKESPFNKSFMVCPFSCHVTGAK